MNVQSDVNGQTATPHLVKQDPASPALKIVDGAIAIKAGTSFLDVSFSADTIVTAGDAIDKPGSDYVVVIGSSGLPEVRLLAGRPVGDNILGGFHFAPGSNAYGRAGGDIDPAINPCSLWDRNFRPACPDPRGMSLIEGPHGHRFWSDIYLLGVDHLADGTSRFNVTIADGVHRPVNPETGKPFKTLDYETAVTVLAHHGKQVPSVEEFFALAIGVTEKTAFGEDPEVTKLDAPRTSKFGIMQATGNMWVWGHDGDPDEPRASIFGGSYWDGDDAGSRSANLDCWPGDSSESVGARGRSDHLQLA